MWVATRFLFSQHCILDVGAVIQHFLKIHKDANTNKTLLQFFVSLKYKKHPNRSRYVIPNFVGLKARPCFPVSNQYTLAVLTIYKARTVFVIQMRFLFARVCASWSALKSAADPGIAVLATS